MVLGFGFWVWGFGFGDLGSEMRDEGLEMSYDF